MKPLVFNSRRVTSTYALSGIGDWSRSEVSFKVTTGFGSKTRPLPSAKRRRLRFSRIAPVSASIYNFHSAGRRVLGADGAGFVFTITFQGSGRPPVCFV